MAANRNRSRRDFLTVAVCPLPFCRTDRVFARSEHHPLRRYRQGGLDILGFSWALGQKGIGQRPRTQTDPMCDLSRPSWSATMMSSLCFAVIMLSRGPAPGHYLATAHIRVPLRPPPALIAFLVSQAVTHYGRRAVCH